MARKTPLVSQYLENISRTALAEYQEIIRRYIRNRHGVYALYRRGKLYYVGLASNLRSRLTQHLKDRHNGSWDRFSVYLTIGDSHLRELESLLLRIVHPGGNKQIGKFHRSCENLRKSFARDLRHLYRAKQLAALGYEVDEDDDESAVAEVDGHAPALLPYLDAMRRRTLRAKFKGQTHKARVRRDGTIRLGQRIYNSPSLAARAICKRNCNGWWFWHYERAPRDWVRLRELRNK